MDDKYTVADLILDALMLAAAVATIGMMAIVGPAIFGG